MQNLTPDQVPEVEDSMDHYTVFPDKTITAPGQVSVRFLELGIETFIDACRFVHELPYGYNSDRADLMILFRERLGTCSPKHAVIATLAAELNLPIHRATGIYAMTEEMVAGADRILTNYSLPYVPTIHCFLVYGDHRVDLTEGNQNGKKCAIDTFLYTEQVTPTLSAREEYLLYRKVLKASIMLRSELVQDRYIDQVGVGRVRMKRLLGRSGSPGTKPLDSMARSYILTH